MSTKANNRKPTDGQSAMRSHAMQLAAHSQSVESFWNQPRCSLTDGYDFESNATRPIPGKQIGNLMIALAYIWKTNGLSKRTFEIIRELATSFREFDFVMSRRLNRPETRYLRHVIVFAFTYSPANS